MNYDNQLVKQLCKSIKTKIGESDLDGAFNDMEKLISQVDKEGVYETDLILMKNRYSRIQKKKMQGILGLEEEREENIITVNLLDFLGKMNVELIVRENQEKIDGIEDAVKDLRYMLSLNVEIAKERINRLGQCWSAMHRFENKLFRIVEDFIQCLLSEKDISEELNTKFKAFRFNKTLDNLFQLLSDESLISILDHSNISNDDHLKLLQRMETAFLDYEEADMVLEENKFWLGYEIYEEARLYHNCYPRFLEQYREKIYTGCLGCLKYQKAAKDSIEAIIKAFLSQIYHQSEAKMVAPT